MAKSVLFVIVVIFLSLVSPPDIVVDQNQSLRFAIDIARGMEFLHSMEPMVPNFVLTSKHVMVSQPLIKQRRSF